MAGVFDGDTYFGDGTSESVTGGARAEIFFMAAGSDTVDGGGGDDTIVGSTDADSLAGGAGNDLVIGSEAGSRDLGADTLDGGAGADTLVSVLAEAGTRIVGGAGRDVAVVGSSAGDVSFVPSVAVVFALDPAGSTVTVGGVAGAYVEAERIDIWGGSAGDSLVGGRDADTLHGLDCDDTLAGGAGDDVVDGGTGANSLDGGIGTDTVSFDLSATADAFDLVVAPTIDLGAFGVARGFEAFGTVQFGSGDDRIVLAGNGSLVEGNDGADTLVGGGGDDTLYGGAGEDALRGGAGDDVLWADNGVAPETRTNAASERVEGDEGDDSLAGGVGRDTLDGGTGDDTLSFTGSDAAADKGSGGDGVDVLGFRVTEDMFADAALDVSLGRTARVIVDGRTLVGATGVEVLAVDASFSGSTLAMTGGAYDDTVFGGASTTADLSDGDDTFNSFAGRDTVAGGDGDDALGTDTEGDAIDAGAGADTVFVVAGFTLLFPDDGEVSTYAGGAGHDTLILAELVPFSETFAFAGPSWALGERMLGTFTGFEALDYRGSDGVADVTGTAGDDTLDMGGGDDRADGGRGADLVTGGDGADTLVGGRGDDTLSYADTQSSVAVTLAGDEAVLAGSETDRIDLVRGFENVVGGSAADELEGDRVGNRLDGGAGGDVLIGGGGVDTLFGGGGQDAFRFVTRPDADVVGDFVARDDRIELLRDAYKGLTLGALDPSLFVANTAGAAEDRDDRIVFSTSTGELIFDANGSKAGGASVIAVLDPDSAVTAADLFVVGL